MIAGARFVKRYHRAMKRTLIALCSILLVASACKKKEEEAKPAEPTAETKPAEAKPAEPAPAPAPAPAEAKAGGATFANAAEYEAKANELMDKMTAMFVADGKDCAKLATDLSKLVDDNKSSFDAASVFEKANPDAKKALDKKMEARSKDFQAKAGPAIEACKDNKALQDAMAKVPD